MAEEYKGVKLNPDFHPIIYDLFDVDPKTLPTPNPCTCCLGSNADWLSYVLPCGHTAHTRCYRKFIGQRGAIECPQCGPLDWKTKCQKCRKGLSWCTCADRKFK